MIEKRKKEHLELCLTDSVAFKNKTNGFENYEFEHFAITEAVPDKISLTTSFFGKEIGFPFMISCMTGGTSQAENINARLAVAANELKIPLGVGSMRQALESKRFINSYKIIRKNAPDVPVLGNIGATQIVSSVSLSDIQFLVDLIKADAFVIHINPLQELMQKDGEPDFGGLLSAIDKITHKLDIPVIAKEVGAGIGRKVAKQLLDAGVKGIDVAGAGGTSWSAVEMLRNNTQEDLFFRDWGLPTSYCIRSVAKLKDKYEFMLIGSGGLNNAVDIAKALALGSDVTASARIILQELDKSGVEGTKSLIVKWFEDVKKIMFLTGSRTLKDFRQGKLVKKGELV
ncbi:MAG: type 2 isopentenyl-diphosphate Delta-isomerase [Ignavibacteria bacterium]